MKTHLLLPRVAFLALVLGTVSFTATFAQSPNPPPDGPPHHGPGGILTPDEKAQLKKAHDAVLAKDPSLQTDEDNLKQQGEALKAKGDAATPAEKHALGDQWHAFMEKMKAAELKYDPSLAPIFAKLEAARKNWHHPENP